MLVGVVNLIVPHVKHSHGSQREPELELGEGLLEADDVDHPLRPSELPDTVGHIPEGVEGRTIAPDEDQAGYLVLGIQLPTLLEVHVDGDTVTVQNDRPFVLEDVGGGLELLENLLRFSCPDKVALVVEGVEGDPDLPQARLEPFQAVSHKLSHLLDCRRFVVLVGCVQLDYLGRGVVDI